jgi:hypothetical protein
MQFRAFRVHFGYSLLDFRHETKPGKSLFLARQAAKEQQIIRRVFKGVLIETFASNENMG